MLQSHQLIGTFELISVPVSDVLSGSSDCCTEVKRLNDVKVTIRFSWFLMHAFYHWSNWTCCDHNHGQFNICTLKFHRGNNDPFITVI